ncbi:MAG: hypothetical protein ACRELS_13400 [Candidatus Rokuibacteriota bacterium]
MKHVILVAVLLAATPVVATAQQVQDCTALPTEAQRPRVCNPRAECLSQVTLRFQGQSSLQDTQRNCQRMPTAGTCYGPETYNPQAECLARQPKR